MYEIGNEELASLEALFKTKKFFRYQGPGVETHTTAFEREFANAINMKKALFVTSGTNALILALEAHGIGAGDEVIIPSYTFVATVNAVLQVGAIPVLCGLKDLVMDPEKVASKISPKTKAIIAVHMDGVTCDLFSLSELANKKNLILIEDVAQAVGGSFAGKPLGSFGNASCFSFNVDKIISCGEGGVVAFNDEELYRKALKAHDGPVIFGATHKDQLADLPKTSAHSMRMSEISAVIIREQLKRLSSIITNLRERKNIWRNEFQLVEGADPSGDCGTTVHLRLSDPAQAASVAQALTKNGVIAVPLYARPAHCFWQWLPVMGLSEIEMKKISFELADDRMKLSSIIRIAVDYNLSLNETSALTKKVKGLLS